ncbi:MAG TPA: DoxX family protein [Vicinamibacterales bacterium]|nr:DoxX family protein [Vicinamibacterales bacterium]
MQAGRAHYVETPGLSDTIPRAQALELLLARIIFGGYFLYSGINHFLHVPQMAIGVAAKGLPLPEAAIIGTGLLLAFGGLSILIGWRPDLGALAIVIFLLGVTPIMHAFWNETDPMARMNQQAHFLKNVGLLAGAIFAAAAPQPWPYSVAARRTMEPALRA